MTTTTFHTAQGSSDTSMLEESDVLAVNAYEASNRTLDRFVVSQNRSLRMYSRGLQAALMLLSMAFLAGCVGDAQDEGPEGREVRDVASFDRIEVSQDFWVIADVKPGMDSDAVVVELEGERTMLPYVRTEVVDGTLKIDSDAYLYSLHPILVHVTVPRLEGVEAKEEASVDVSGIAGTRFHVVGLDDSNIRLEGGIEALDLDVDGAPGIDATALRSYNADVAVQGNRAKFDVELCVTGTLAVEGNANVANVCTSR